MSGFPNNKCAFCKEDRPLKESHIIPKFVYDWVKSTSPTPYLRYSNNVEKREQDGPKQKLLCEDCELLFSKWENVLSQEVFKKLANYQVKNTKLNISSESLLAILSIFWRKLITIDYSIDNNWTDEDRFVIQDLAKRIKSELLTRNPSQKILFIPVTEKLISSFESPDVARYYLERSVDNFNIRFLDEPHRYIAFFKFPFMYFYILSDGWSTSEINDYLHLNKGQVSFEDKDYSPRILKQFLQNSLQQYRITLSSMSSEETSKISSEILNNERFKSTGAYKSLVLRNINSN